MKNSPLIVQLTFLFLLIQFSTPDISQAQSWNLGFGYSINMINEPNNVNFYTNNGYYIDEFELNYRIGLSVERRWENNLSINTGVYYAQNNYNADLNCASCNTDLKVACPECYYNLDSKDFNKSYLEVPITGRYYFLNKKIFSFTDIGVINNFLLEESEFPDRGYYLNAVGGVGLGTHLFKNWQLESSLKYTTQILTLYNNSDYIQKLLRLEFGIKREF